MWNDGVVPTFWDNPLFICAIFCAIDITILKKREFTLP